MAFIDVIKHESPSDEYFVWKHPNEQIKLAIFVLDKELRSDAIRVIVYVQTLNGDVWEDDGIDNILATRGFLKMSALVKKYVGCLVLPAIKIGSRKAF